MKKILGRFLASIGRFFWRLFNIGIPLKVVLILILLVGGGSFWLTRSKMLEKVGGKEDYDEVTAMKAYAMEQGVPEKDIFLDHAGFSTYETMYRAATIFRAQSCVVVTQRYHLSRAVYLANTMDMETYGVEADREPYQRIRYFEAREALARVKDVIFAVVRPEPTYLGAPISLDGDGRVTAQAPFAMPILAEGWGTND